MHSNRGTGGLTTSGGGRGPLITPAPPTTTVKCFDGRWPSMLSRQRHSETLHTTAPCCWCAIDQCDHRVGEGCVIMYCMAPSPWRINTNTTTVGPCSATLVRAGHGARHGLPLCASVARPPPHSVHGNARAPPWRGTAPPWRCAGHHDALSHHGGATTGARLILGQLGAPGCRWQPHGGVNHVTVVQSPHRWESVPTGGMTAPQVGQSPPAPPLFAVGSSCPDVMCLSKIWRCCGSAMTSYRRPKTQEASSGSISPVHAED